MKKENNLEKYSLVAMIKIKEVNLKFLDCK